LRLVGLVVDDDGCVRCGVRVHNGGLLLWVYGDGGDLRDVDSSTTSVAAGTASDQAVGVGGRRADVVCRTAPVLVRL
jgi:hypothetical protein